MHQPNKHEIFQEKKETEKEEEEKEKSEEIEPEMSENAELELLKELETKIRVLPTLAEIISSIINQSEDEGVKEFQKQEQSFTWNEENIKGMLVLAVKYDKGDTVDFLIKCGVKANVIDNHGKSAAYYAWQNKNYKMVFSLLKADSFFPDELILGELKEDDELKGIINLVEIRRKLHEAIKNDQVEDVKNLTQNENSILYLNEANESAAYIALKYKKFTTYAYLKSIGAELGKSGEEKILNSFQLKENVSLQEAMVRFFSAQPDAHIHYLISKCRTRKSMKILSDKLKDYYRQLNDIPEISPILKVVQYADYLDIIFDFDEEEISRIYPLVNSNSCSRGLTEYKIGRVYIAANARKRKPEEILGTIVHELTHVAMQMLFGNDCNPYKKLDNDKSVIRLFQDLKTRIPKDSESPSKILLDAISFYEPVDHDSELISRVPQILAQFQNGKDWLKNRMPSLLNFYEKTIIPKCEDFARDSVILKPRSIIKSINERVGEIVRLRRCKAFFTDAPKFQSGNKNIFVIEVKSTLLGLLKVLQRLFGKCYGNSHSQFLVFKFENFVGELNGICQAFFLEGCDWLIIEILKLANEAELETICEKLSYVLEMKSHKRIIFIAQQNVTKFLWTTLEKFNLLHISREISDNHLGLDSLDKSSQNVILKKKVYFQGKLTTLERLFQAPDMYHLINPEIIENILEGKIVHIGNKILGLSNLEGAYGEVVQEINFESFVRQVTTSNEFFIVRSEPKEEILRYFNSKFARDYINIDFFTNNVIFDFENFSFRGKIFLVNDWFESEDFKNFCKFKSRNASYLIDVRDLKNDSFILQGFYNPNFYVERNIKKIFTKLDKVESLITDCIRETFIISNELNSTKEIFKNFNNVKCFDAGEAEKNFKILSQPGVNIHWFKLENERLVWIDSYGSVKNLRGSLQNNRMTDPELSESDEDWDDDSNNDPDNKLSLSNDFWSNNNRKKTETKKTVIKEKKFISEIIHKRVLLITDEVGTGKSTTLTKLYEAKPIADEHWIIRINLKDHIEDVRKETSSNALNLEKTIRFLQTIHRSLKNEFNKTLLKIMLTTKNKFSKCLLLVFDGFDEILDENDRKNVINLLTFLKNETYCKIWITSRLQYKIDLEQELDTFAIEFEPFDTKTQTSFIQEYLKSRLKLIVKEALFYEIFEDKKGPKILTFTKQLLLKTKEIFKQDFKNFIGIPLQLNLVLSDSVEHFINWAEKGETLDFNYLGKDLEEVYQNFIEKKYSIYFKKRKIIVEKDERKVKKESENYNKNLAESLIYKREVLKPDDDDKEIFLLIGLIQSQNNENFEFIHFTFREYYFAKIFAEYIINKTLIREKMMFLFEEIFIKKELQMIPQFLNIQFKQKPSEEQMEAEQYDKADILNFFIKCGVKVDTIDDNGNSAADYAWTNKNYKMLFLLLKADLFFPAGFDLRTSSQYDDDDRKKIKDFVDKRNQLHEVIRNGDDLEVVRNFTLGEDSNLYLNANNESAIYTALKHKKFATYVYLKSIGAKFATNEEEKETIASLQPKDEVALRELMMQYFPKVSDVHINYLISKSRSTKPIEDFDGKLKDYYSRLDHIPEISLILKVLQHAEYLDIVFDFDAEEILKVYPSRSSKYGKLGKIEYKEERIHIAANSKHGYEEILGTIAHEFTHMAMQILYENECNPYRTFDEETANFFRDLKLRIRGIGRTPGDPSTILMGAIDNYEDSDHDSELIACVPHILAQYKTGKDWLKNQIPELFNFYTNTIIPQGMKFTEESIIKSINRRAKVLEKLKKYNVLFKHAPNLFQNVKQIFVIKTVSTLLGMLKVLQRLYGKGYTHSDIEDLVLKYENLLSELSSISEVFLMEKCDRLIIEISHPPIQTELDKIFDNISELLVKRPRNKVIFVAQRNVAKFLWTTLEKFNLLHISREISDDHLSLNSIDKSSRKVILKKKVYFHGKQTTLGRLIQAPDLYHLINPEIIESMLEGKIVHIGNKLLGLSNLEGAYGDVVQEINFESFVRQVTTSTDIFIVRSELKDEVLEYFNRKFEKLSINTEFFNNITYVFENEIFGGRIVLVNDHFESRDFKNFCQINFRKKSYLIEVKDLNSDSFALKEVYNPKVYIERNFKNISIKSDEMIKVIDSLSENFVVGNIFDPKKLHLEGYKNLICSYDTGDKEKFDILSKPGNHVHWFRLENDRFIWMDSYGPICNLRKILKKYGSATDAIECCDDIKDDSDGDNYLSADTQKDMNKKEAPFNTGDIMPEMIEKKMMLITGNLGTGKSTALINLYQEAPIEDKHWIIRINLKDHFQVIREEIYSKTLNVEGIIKLLQKIEPNLKNELDENLLKIMLTTENKFSRILLLAFDEFDEILEEDDRKNIMDVLKFLKNETHCKIWIASDFKYKEILENELETLAIEMQPFDVKTQKLYIVKYLKDRLQLTFKEESFLEIFEDKRGSKISVFTEGLLLKMKEIFKTDLRNLIGVPLKLNLVLSCSVEYFRHWAENGKELDFSYLGNHWLDVYDNFIENKYRVYFKKFNEVDDMLQKRDKENSEKYNKSLAESLIYKREVLAAQDEYKEMLFSIELVQSTNDKNFDFIHLSFREYYFATICEEYIFTGELCLEKIMFVFEEIFIKKEFQIIRYFLNLRLKESLPEKKREEIQNLLLNAPKPYTSWYSGLVVSGKENLENIFKLISSIFCNKTARIVPTKVLNREVFHAAAMGGNLQLCKDLSGMSGGIFIDTWEYLYYKALFGESIYLAILLRNWKLTTAFLKYIKGSFPKDEIPTFLKPLQEKYKIFNKIIQWTDSFELLGLILEEEYLTMEEQKQLLTKEAIVLSISKKKDWRLMELLLKRCKDILTFQEIRQLLMTKDNFGKTMLHVAAENGNLEISKLILSEIKQFNPIVEQEQFITLKDYKDLTALYLAVKAGNINVVNLLIDEGKEILKLEQFKKYFWPYGWNEAWKQLPYTGMNTESIKCLYGEGKWMFPLEEPLRWLLTYNNYNETLLHQACLHNDTELITFILGKLSIKEINEVLMTANKEGHNCIDLSIQGGRIEFLKLLFAEIEKFLSPERQWELLMMTMNSWYQTVQRATTDGKSLHVFQFLFDKITTLLKPEKQPKFFTSENFENIKSLAKVLPVDITELILMKIKKLPGSSLYVQLFDDNTILDAAVLNQDPRAAKLIFEKMEEILDVEKCSEILMKTDQNGKTYFHLTAEKSPKVLKFFFEKAEQILILEDQRELLSKTDVFGNNVLHLLGKSHLKSTGILEFLLEKMDEILPIEKRREFLMMTNKSKERAIDIYSDDNGGVKLILEKSSDILNPEQLRQFLTKDYNKSSVFFRCFTIGDSHLFELLLQISEKIMEPEHKEFLTKELWDRLLSDINFDRGSGNALERLLQYTEKIPLTEKQREILMMKMSTVNERNETALHIILKSRLITSETLGILFEKWETILTPEQQLKLFMMTDDFNNTVFHTASIIEDFDKTKLVFDKGEKMMKQDFYLIFTMTNNSLRNILQLAASLRKYEVANFIIKKANEILKLELRKKFLLITDTDNKTILHLAAENKILQYENEDIELANKWQDYLKVWKKGSDFVNLILKEAGNLFMLEERRKFLMIEDRNGRTAFDIAVDNDEIEAIRLLLQEAENIFTREDLQKFVYDRSRSPEQQMLSYIKDNTIKNLITSFIKEKTE